MSLIFLWAWNINQEVFGSSHHSSFYFPGSPFRSLLWLSVPSGRTVCIYSLIAFPSPLHLQARWLNTSPRWLGLYRTSYYFITVSTAITKAHKEVASNSRNLLSHNSGDQKSENKVFVGPCSLWEESFLVFSFWWSWQPSGLLGL